MRAILLTLTLLLISAQAIAADAPPQLVLGSSSLGPLALKKGAKITEARLRKLFPTLLVTYDIGYGDSPDFHYFEVANKTGEVLFTIQSFIKESSKSHKTTLGVPIDILKIHSPRIRDIYGLKVGDRVADIIKKRGKKLDFGAGHHDALMGAGKIYYSLITESEYSPERFVIEDAVKGNWKIRMISWPVAAWE